MSVVNISMETFNAIKAAQLWKQCGRYAMTRFAVKRGVDMRLVRLARQLQAVENCK